MTDIVEIPKEVQDFAELMVEEILAKLRVKIEDGGWSIVEQREIISACIAEQDIKRALRAERDAQSDTITTLRADNAALREALQMAAERITSLQGHPLQLPAIRALLDHP